MRTTLSLNQTWSFCPVNGDSFETVNIPHTWNALDGQDGDGTYLRGTATYSKTFMLPALTSEEAYLEFNGVGNVADVYVNDHYIGHHEGGFSRFRFCVTDALQKGENQLVVKVDNGKNHVYPQMADFTFYGGIYRDVNLIIVESLHFELLHYATPGIKVTPTMNGKDAQVIVETWQNGGTISVTVNGEKQTKISEDGHATFTFTISNVHLWNGREDPYLYSAKAELINQGQVLDELEVLFGCRTFEMDAEKGFLLNGKSYPLRGVSRHQDRKGIGNALTKEMHAEDMHLIYDMGANSVRLAHYQHDQYFYDLCDRLGLIVWAEIPYISSHMEEGNENIVSQLKELIIQNYNHPSIAVWGLSNEITMQGNSEDLYQQHLRLNALAHELDPSRKTVMANVSMLATSNRLIDLPDVLAYNLYFGWYVGELKDNDAFFDRFHEEHPHRPIGLSEYGCDTNIQYHSSKPSRGDYSEEYQCVYHAHILKMLETRPWIWCSYAWNMFDFAADARNEGGAKGINQKGLVTFDRAICKDAYYLYQAHWSKEPMLHIAGRRYGDRNEKVTDICVYTNLEVVDLYVDDVFFAKASADKEVHFSVPITKEHTIVAKANELQDQITIRYVKEPNESYIHKGSGILNWFDADGLKSDYYSLEDSLADLANVEEAQDILNRVIHTEAEGDGKLLQAVRKDPSLLKTMKDVSLLHLLEDAGNPISNNIKRMINSKLQQIKKG